MNSINKTGFTNFHINKEKSDKLSQDRIFKLKLVWAIVHVDIHKALSTSYSITIYIYVAN